MMQSQYAVMVNNTIVSVQVNVQMEFSNQQLEALTYGDSKMIKLFSENNLTQLILDVF